MRAAADHARIAGRRCSPRSPSSRTSTPTRSAIAAIDHRHTIAHAPPICDGASLALLGTSNGSVRPRARIVSYAECGGDPHASLLAGFGAMDRALSRAGMTLDDIDCIEFMEAFAVTIAKFLRDRHPRSGPRQCERRPHGQGSSDGRERRHPAVYAARCARSARCDDRAGRSERRRRRRRSDGRRAPAVNAVAELRSHPSRGRFPCGCPCSRHRCFSSRAPSWSSRPARPASSARFRRRTAAPPKSSTSG